MKKWNMIIDVAECTNCQLCTLATMDEYVGNDWPGYTKPMPKHGHKWINILQKERGQIPMIDIAYVPTMCNHCDDAPCIAKSDGAITKRDDGIVLIDQERAKGRKDLVDACPYGHIWWNEEQQVPQHWPFDAHLIDQGWQQTRGHQSCPTSSTSSRKTPAPMWWRLPRATKRRAWTRSSAKASIWVRSDFSSCVMAGHSASKTRVNALMPGHPRLS
jgi:Fe-S-cluster-containing dehydrogenase component